MKNKKTYYEELINRYFAGEADANDMAELSSWINSNTQNKKLFEEYRKSWMAVHGFSIDKHVNIDQEWVILQKKIESLDKETIVKPLWGYANLTRIAASLIILLGLFFILKYLVFNESFQTITANTGLTVVKLPDGSIITLNQHATLKYPEEFKPEKRHVELKGEAYFEVVTKPAQPFVVSYENIRIEVMGTSFNISSSIDEENIEVVLDEGEIAVYFKQKPDSRVIMKPQDKSVISLSENKIVKKVNKDPNYLSWKTRYFIFDNTPLSEVIIKLGKVYGKEIIITNQDIASCRLTATFNDQTLSSILKVLQATFDLKIEIVEKKIRIEGNGCN